MTTSSRTLSDRNAGVRLPKASLFAVHKAGRRPGPQVAREQADLIAAVNHALRTPLTSVIGYAEVLLSGDAGELTAEQRSMVLRMGVNGVRLLERVEELVRSATVCLATDQWPGLDEMLQRVVSTPRAAARRGSVEPDLGDPGVEDRPVPTES